MRKNEIRSQGEINMTANSLKEQPEEQKEKETKPTKKKKQRIRKFPIWLRLIVVFILIAISLALGLIVGYSIMGDGNAMDVFQKSTWQHIIDIVNKE